MYELKPIAITAILVFGFVFCLKYASEVGIARATANNECDPIIKEKLR